MRDVIKLSLMKKQSEVDSILEDKADYYRISEWSDDFLYCEARALSIGHPNANGDLFVMDEIKAIHEASGQPAYKTFVGRGVYVNHNSDDPANSIGLIFDSTLVEGEDPHIRLLIGIDRKKAPDIVDGLGKKTINSWSMGTTIKYSICTYCGKKIVDETDLCDCLKYHRGEKIGDIIVAEKLHGLEFYEESVVTMPADYKSRLINILASSNEERRKVASMGEMSLINLLTEKIYTNSYREKTALLEELVKCENGKCKLY